MVRRHSIVWLLSLASVWPSFISFDGVGARGSDQTASPSWHDRSYRQRSALKWRDGFRALDRQTPTLSPAEERWLKIEIDDEIATNGNRYTKRALAAMDSREYDVRVAKAGLREITTLLDILGAERAPILREEVRRWTELAARFLDKDFWQAIDGLVRRKLVDARINGVDSLYFENHVLWAKGLIEGIVQPFVQGTLK